MMAGLSLSHILTDHFLCSVCIAIMREKGGGGEWDYTHTDWALMQTELSVNVDGRRSSLLDIRERRGKICCDDDEELSISRDGSGLMANTADDSVH